MINFNENNHEHCKGFIVLPFGNVFSMNAMKRAEIHWIPHTKCHNFCEMKHITDYKLQKTKEVKTDLCSYVPHFQETINHFMERPVTLDVVRALSLMSSQVVCNVPPETWKTILNVRTQMVEEKVCISMHFFNMYF